MKKIYIVTGANGHLGGTLVRMLSKRGEAVRGLVLPGEAPQPFPHVRYYTGDVRDADSMRPLFADAEDAELLVLHTAGLVDIADAVSDRLYDVNVNGTKNMLALCREYNVRRLVYVSSVHAIPEEKSPAVLKEVSSFSPGARDGRLREDEGGGDAGGARRGADGAGRGGRASVRHHRAV